MKRMFTVLFRCPECPPGERTGTAVIEGRTTEETMPEFIERLISKCRQMHHIGAPRCPTERLEIRLPPIKVGGVFFGEPITEEDAKHVLERAPISEDQD